MIGGLMGRKLAMTQMFEGGSVLTPVTLLEVGPCRVIRAGGDSSSAQIGYGEDKSPTKAAEGHFAAAGLPAMKRMIETSCDDGVKAGDVFTAEIFKEGDKVDVVGASKGKGFTGAMKRHGFSGQPASHGGKAHRRPGSIGQASYPARVWKGIKMAGRAGGGRITAQGLRVVSVDAGKNLVAVKGSVPGPRGANVFIRHAVKGGGQVADG